MDFCGKKKTSHPIRAVKAWGLHDYNSILCALRSSICTHTHKNLKNMLVYIFSGKQGNADLVAVNRIRQLYQTFLINDLVNFMVQEANNTLQKLFYRWTK